MRFTGNSVLHGLARTPFDVADTHQYLAGDNNDRRVDAAEIRYTLAQQKPRRLLRIRRPADYALQTCLDAPQG